MKKLNKIFIFALVLVLAFGTVSAFAVEPYDTYTYSIDGKPLKSPAAYSAIASYDSLSMEIGKISDVPTLSSASDIVVDHEGYVYIADTGNNRIVVLDKYYNAKAIISEYEENGKTYTLKAPQGLFVTNPLISENEDEKHIYVCDTGNNQIVVFNKDFEYERTIEKPDTPLLSAGAFKPCAIAVDIYGRIFITSTACYEGVIVLSSKGDFSGFIGAQKVTYTVFEMIWRRFQSSENRDSSAKKIAIPYNNITVDNEGFAYVTTNTNDLDQQEQQFTAIRSKNSSYSPVKKLNSKGDEIMKRNGFFDPGGEVDVMSGRDVSQIIDVAVGDEGSWTILDKQRNRMFTYDQNGNLLFAFGDKGDSLGNGESVVGMTYHNIDGVSYIAVLDNATVGYKINIYAPTPYRDTIIAALRNQNEHNYSASITCWQDVLTLNNNFDLAYIGIGKALAQQGKYDEAQQMLARAYEVEQYTIVFKEIRTQFLQKYLLPIAALIIAIIVLFVKFMGYAKRKNKVTTLKVGKKTYWEELIFAFHLVFHPFDGFWDLKHEKRGSVRASATFMGITIVAFFYQAIGQGYTFNPRGDYSTIFFQVIAVLVPLILWCVANWCLTTLFDGEGSFKDIFIATGYACAPLPLFIIISTVLTNVMTSSEGQIVSLFMGIAYVWVAMLLFFGTMITHDYTMNKNFVTVLGTIVAMAVIMFVVILFSSLVAKMATFFISLFSEIGNRI